MHQQQNRASTHRPVLLARIVDLLVGLAGVGQPVAHVLVVPGCNGAALAEGIMRLRRCGVFKAWQRACGTHSQRLAAKSPRVWPTCAVCLVTASTSISWVSSSRLPWLLLSLQWDKQCTRAGQGLQCCRRSRALGVNRLPSPFTPQSLALDTAAPRKQGPHLNSRSSSSCLIFFLYDCTSSSSACRCSSSSCFSFRISLPSSWSSRPATFGVV